MVVRQSLADATVLSMPIANYYVAIFVGRPGIEPEMLLMPWV